jgi:hypothetical protein
VTGPGTARLSCRRTGRPGERDGPARALPPGAPCRRRGPARSRRIGPARSRRIIPAREVRAVLRFRLRTLAVGIPGAGHGLRLEHPRVLCQTLQGLMQTVITQPSRLLTARAVRGPRMPAGKAPAPSVSRSRQGWGSGGHSQEPRAPAGQRRPYSTRSVDNRAPWSEGFPGRRAAGFPVSTTWVTLRRRWGTWRGPGHGPRDFCGAEAGVDAADVPVGATAAGDHRFADDRSGPDACHRFQHAVLGGLEGEAGDGAAQMALQSSERGLIRDGAVGGKGRVCLGRVAGWGWAAAGQANDPWSPRMSRRRTRSV